MTDDKAGEASALPPTEKPASTQETPAVEAAVTADANGTTAAAGHDNAVDNQPPPATTTTTTTSIPVTANAVEDPTSTSTNNKPVTPPAQIARKPLPDNHAAVDIDKSKPDDFEGEVLTNNEIPSPETLKKIEDYIVLDRHGRSHPFKTLYSGPNVARRVLMIFIRHFFCGNCQDYIRSLSDAITPESLLGLPVSTFIVIIGCGDPSFIEQYARDTNCRFPIYTDPRRSLFDVLEMKQTLALGSKPEYMKRPMSTSMFQSVLQGLRAIPTGKALKGGNQRQVGGEFLFEPLDIVTPVTTPRQTKRQTFLPEQSEKQPRVAPAEDDEDGPTEPKRISWCHRMKSTRDHCEIPELMEVLGLTESGTPLLDEKEKWTESQRKRKGTGSSMARAMSELSNENREHADAK